MPVLHLARWSAFAMLVLSGCGGSGFDGRVYQNGDLSFRLSPIPRAWRPIEATGALLAFRDDAGPATIAIGGRCGKDGDDVPLEALTHHLFLDFTDRVVENQVKVDLDGREALQTEIRAKLDGVERRLTVFVMKKNGCVYDFWHVAPPEAPADSRRQFIAFVQGFSTIRP